MKIQKFSFSIKVLGLLLFIGLAYMSIVLESCTKANSENWSLYRTIAVENFTPTGITNHDRLLLVSDSSRDEILIFDTLDGSIQQKVSVSTPVYIESKKSRLLIPSFYKDTIYVFRGGPLYKLLSFSELSGPTSADAIDINNYAIVDHQNDRVLYSKDDFKIIIDGQEDNQSLEKPSNVMLLNDKIYVLDSGNKEVKVFYNSGEFDFSFGENQKFKWPIGMCSDENFIYISDSHKNIICVYNHEGEFIEKTKNSIHKPEVIIAGQKLSLVGKLHVQDTDNFLGSTWMGLRWEFRSNLSDNFFVTTGRIGNKDKIYLSIKLKYAGNTVAKDLHVRLVEQT